MKKNRIIAIFTTALLSFSLPFTSQNMAFAATKINLAAKSTPENPQEDKTINTTPENPQEDKTINSTREASEQNLAIESNPENSEQKALLKEDLESLEESSPGLDYDKNHLILLCDSKEEAKEAAKAYSEASGIKVELESHSYGVALLALSEYENKAPIEVDGETVNISNDPVKALIKLSSSQENSLPPLYADNYEELETINTDNEGFNDPYLKYKGKDSGSTSGSYQWFHDIIGSKFVWKAMEEGELSDPKDLVVAIVDTGLNYNHEEFKNTNIVDPENVANESADYIDVHGHGTNIAGIIASEGGNEKGGRGIASSEGSSVSLMPVCIYNNGSVATSSTLKALNYIVEEKNKGVNVGVVNISSGSSNFNSAYLEVIRKVSDAGIVICAASGNYSTDAAFYPAAYPGVISVASVNSYGQRSSFSNYGTTVDIAAPGGDSGYRCFTDDQGKVTVKSLTENLYEPDINGESGYSGKKGTSQACPVVTAAAALLLANNKDLTPSQVLDRLKSSATPYSDDSGRYLGAGIVNVANALLGQETVNSPKATLISEDLENETGTISENSAIYITNDHTDGLVYYTLDGSDPDPDNVTEKALKEDLSGTRIYTEEIKLSDILSALDYNSAGETAENAATYISEGNPTTLIISLNMTTLLYGRKSETSNLAEIIDLTKMEETLKLSAPAAATKLCVGGKLKLSTEISPAQSLKKSIIWESLDTTVLTVNSEGLVTALSPSKTDEEGNLLPVKIRATIDDGSNASDEYEITVLPKAETLTVDAFKPTDPTTGNDRLILYIGSETGSYDLSDKWQIWPKTAAQEVEYISSNSKVIRVSDQGLVTPLSEGDAFVTLKAKDGSNLKDIVKFRVMLKLDSMELTDPSGNNKLSAGSSLTPKLTYNASDLTPKNKKLEYSIVSGQSYANINKNSGILTAYSNDKIGKGATVIIQAYSPYYNVYSNTLSISLYPRVENLLPKTEGKEFYRNNTYDLDSCYTVLPQGAFTEYDWESSNDRVAIINSEGKLSCLNEGSAVITLKALDGSAKTLDLNIRVKGSSVSGFGLISDQEGIPVLVPGRTISFDYNTSYSSEKSGNIYYRFATTEDGSRVYKKTQTDFLRVDNGKVSFIANDSDIKALKDYYLEKYEAGEDYSYYELLYSGYGTLNESTGNVTFTSSANCFTCIYIYPSAVESVFFPEDKNSSIVNGKMTLNNIGSGIYINPDTKPLGLTYNKEFAYKSSNTRVVKAYEDGYLEAVGNGTATVTVSALDGSNKKATVKITVDQGIDTVTLNPQIQGTTTLSPGKSLKLLPSFNNGVASRQPKTKKLLYSCDSSLATVNASGVVKVDKKTVITEKTDVTITACSAADPSIKGSCTLTLQPPASSFILSSNTIKDINSDTKVDLSDPALINVAQTINNESKAAKDITCNYKFTVKNTDILKAEWAESDGDTISLTGSSPNLVLTPLAKGKTSLIIESLDGSKLKRTLTINVIKPVTSMILVTQTGSYELLAGKSLDICALCNSSKEEYKESLTAGTKQAKSWIKDKNKEVTLSKVSYYLLDDKGNLTDKLYDGNTLYASINKRSGRLTSKASGCKGYTLNVKALAESNGIDIASAPLSLTVKPWKDYAESLAITSKTGYYNASYGSGLKLNAILNENVYDKNLTWSAEVLDSSSTDNTAIEEIIDISSLKKGIIKPKSQEICYNVKVTASSVALTKDGNRLSDSVIVKTFPKISNINITSTPESGITQINVWEDLELEAESLGDYPLTLDEYDVIYTTGSAKVYLTGDYSGKTVKVYGYKKGSVKITFISKDGSNKKASYTVKIN